MDTRTLIDKLTVAISYYYREDKTSPGLTISKLKTGYYCSIVKYGGTYGNSKEVICKATADRLHLALQDVALQFLNIAYQPKDPIQELNIFVRDGRDS